MARTSPKRPRLPATPTLTARGEPKMGMKGGGGQIDPDTGLNVLQERFCQAYTRHRNAGRAYIDAGYQAVDPTHAAHRLLDKPHIAARVAELDRLALLAAGYTREEHLTHLVDMARLDPAEVLRWDGTTVTVRSPDELTAEQRRCIKRMKPVMFKDGSKGVEVEFYDRQGAMTQLSKIMGLDAAQKILLQGDADAPLGTQVRELTDEELAERISQALATRGS